MQAPCCCLPRAALAHGVPTVGDLMSLCEENYALLARLAPGLAEAHGVQISRTGDGVDLHLRIEGQSRYTTLLRLTYYFHEGPQEPDSHEPAADPRPPDVHPGASSRGPDPDVLLRVYHDARQVEVLDLRQTALPRHADYRPPALLSKWRVNQFLWKWLGFCVQQGHCFGPQAASLPRSPNQRVPSCTRARRLPEESSESLRKRIEMRPILTTLLGVAPGPRRAPGPSNPTWQADYDETLDQRQIRGHRHAGPRPALRQRPGDPRRHLGEPGDLTLLP